MSIIFITGLTGVGKSSVLMALNQERHSIVDLDDEYLTYYRKDERVFNEDKIVQLIESHKNTQLFLAGTEENQGNLYSFFTKVVLLTADLDTMLNRIDYRTTNDYGKNPEERKEIIDTYYEVLPLLKIRADVFIDTTSQSIQDVCTQLISLL